MTKGTANLTLSVKNLSHRYSAATGVNAINFEMRRGEVLGLLGPNGAGKSTTMRMLTGNLAPSTGSVFICGVDLLKNPGTAKLHLGYLPEIPPLYLDMSVDEYLQLAATLHRVASHCVESAVIEARHRCGLDGRGRQIIGTLSKGFQQRVGIAQAIVHSPDVIILDEPTNGLDPNQIREVRHLIRALATCSCVIFSTHILSEVENVCDRVLIMHQGDIVFDQKMDDIHQQQIRLDAIFTDLTQKHEGTEGQRQ